jgi:hypothetical protein
MKPVEIASSEERQIWRERGRQLELHKINKHKYYPNELDKWYEKGKEIVYDYNIRLQEVNKKRRPVIIRRSRRLEMIAAQALLELKTLRL